MGSIGAQRVPFYDYAIVGAGPAGIQMAYFLQKSRRSYLVLEAGSGPGTFFRRYPRHRTLISINKKYNYFHEDDYNLRHDWNSLLSDNSELRFTKYTDKLFPDADDYMTYLHDFVDHYQLKIQYNSRVKLVSKDTVTKVTKDVHEDEEDGGFLLTVEQTDDVTGHVTQDGDPQMNTERTYRAGVVLMACGAMKERVPDIPGIHLAATYGSHSLDRDIYTNKRVAVIGAGNSAFETADYLAGHAAYIHIYSHSPLKMAWDSHFPGHIRAVNNNVIDMTHLKSLHAIRQADITKLEAVAKDGGKEIKMYFRMDLPNWNPPGQGHFFQSYDHVIYCTGWNYVIPEMFDKDCRPDLCPKEKMAAVNEKWESSVKNLYFIGTCMQVRDMRAASPFIHGFRYGVRSLYFLLEHLRHQQDLPHVAFSEIDFHKLSFFMLSEQILPELL